MGHLGQPIIFVAAAAISAWLAADATQAAAKSGRERGPTEFVKIEKGLGPDGRIAVLQFDRGDGINAVSPAALRQ
jgi:hypothetical protein